MTPFYEQGSIVLKLQNHNKETSLLFTTNCPEIPGTHLSTLER